MKGQGKGAVRKEKPDNTNPKESLNKKKHTTAFDNRFDTKNDPRFKKAPTKVKKVVIDDRFSKIIKDSNFSSAPKVDKYGRKIAPKKDTELEELYEFEGEKGNNPYDKNGNFVWNEVSSSESESESEAEVTPQEVDVWERNKNVTLGEETSRRLAILGLHWEEITATDIFVLCESALVSTRKHNLNSKNTSGKIESVQIYLSDFGEEQLKKEAVFGPTLPTIKDDSDSNLSDQEDSDAEELSEGDSQIAADSQSGGDAEDIANEEADAEDIDEEDLEVAETSEIGSVEENLSDEDSDDYKSIPLINAKTADEQEKEKAKAVEAVRAYEIQKSRYYYAIVTCRDIDSAVKIYETIDGIDSDLALDTVDVQFVPDEVVPPRKPTSESRGIPLTYKPPEASASALRHANAECSWDSTPASRTKMLKKKFTKEEMADLDLKAFLASSDDDSTDEEKDDEERITANNVEEYRKLLLDFEDDEEDIMMKNVMEREKKSGKKSESKKTKKVVEESDDEDYHMEIHVDPEMDKLTEKIAQKAKIAAADGESKIAADVDERTPWQKFLDKKKDSKKARKQKIKELKQNKEDGVADNDSDDALVSGDSDDNETEVKGEKKVNKWRARLKEKIKSDRQKKENKSLAAKLQVEDEQGFKMDYQDDRFFKKFQNNSEFAIDPTNPAYKNTPVNKQLVQFNSNKKRRLH